MPHPRRLTGALHPSLATLVAACGGGRSEAGVDVLADPITRGTALGATGQPMQAPGGPARGSGSGRPPQ